jgi:hypothetical protein
MLMFSYKETSITMYVEYSFARMGAEERPKRRRARTPLSSRDGLQKNRALALKLHPGRRELPGTFHFGEKLQRRILRTTHQPILPI